MKSESLDPLVKQLSICGQVAEHKAQIQRQHGGDEAAVLCALSPEEKNQLGTLLTILQKCWLEEHAAHHQKEKRTTV